MSIAENLQNLYADIIGSIHVHKRISETHRRTFTLQHEVVLTFTLFLY